MGRGREGMKDTSDRREHKGQDGTISKWMEGGEEGVKIKSKRRYKR